MIISCPQCDTNYNIPDETLKQGGRKVRCSTCSHRWQVVPPPPVDSELDPFDEEPDDLVQAEDEVGDRLRDRFTPSGKAVSESTSRTSARAIVGWCLLVVLVASIATFILAREKIASIFPSMQGIYQTVGLPIEVATSLRFGEVSSEEVVQDGQAVILISGLVINDGVGTASVPKIQVALLDEARIALETTDLATLESELEAGGMTRFEALFSNPPDVAQHFSVTFIDAASMRP